MVSMVTMIMMSESKNECASMLADVVPVTSNRFTVTCYVALRRGATVTGDRFTVTCYVARGAGHP